MVKNTRASVFPLSRIVCHFAYLQFQKLTLLSTGEMESWKLHFQNGTTVTGAGMPPVLWVKQPAQETSITMFLQTACRRGWNLGRKTPKQNSATIQQHGQIF